MSEQIGEGSWEYTSLPRIRVLPERTETTRTFQEHEQGPSGTANTLQMLDPLKEITFPIPSSPTNLNLNIFGPVFLLM